MSPCCLFSHQNFIVKQRKKKNLVYQNQGWEPSHQKYKANENTSRHNPKKKQKQTINKNQVKTPCKENSWLQNDNQ
jgi:hypothetical protein